MWVVGGVISYVVDIGVAAVLGVDAALLATQAGTFIVTSHSPDGVTVHLYTLLAVTVVNKLIVQLFIFTPHDVNQYTSSLNVHVTIKFDVLKYAHTLLVSMIDGSLVL